MEEPLSVMVVDDQAPFRMAARAVIRRSEGFTLAGEAENGVKAIELASEIHPDVVLMDINMPEMGGIEATRAHRRRTAGDLRHPVLDLRHQ